MKETVRLNVFPRAFEGFARKKRKEAALARVQCNKFEGDVGNAVIINCSRKRDKSMMIVRMTVIDIVVISDDLR